MPAASITNLEDLPVVLTMRQVMSVLGISKPKAFELLAYPGFPAKRFGKAIRVSRDGLIRWLEGRDVVGPDDAA
jgi:hypothetical protein